MGKLIFFVRKQFFAFGKAHQTLMRSRLSAVFSARLRLDYENFDAREDVSFLQPPLIKFALAQDDG